MSKFSKRDFAESKGGRIRRDTRKARIAEKRAFISL